LTKLTTCGIFKVMKKTKDIHIRVTDEQFKIIQKIAIKDKIKTSQVTGRALENYFVAKRMR